MKKIVRIILLLSFVLLVFYTKAQQIPSSNQYLVNRYLIAPSYAGHDGKSQVFIGYRDNWRNIENAPKTSLITAYVPVSEKVWMGAQIISDNAGVFNNIYAQLSYTYHLEIGYKKMIYFGMWGSMFQNKITLTDAIVSDPNDPLLQGHTELTGFSVNAGTSIVLKWHNAYVGVSIPYLFKNIDIYALNDAQNVVELYTQIIAHASYRLRFSYDFDIEPMIVYKWIQNYDSQIEASLRVIYQDDYWVGATYRSIGKTGVSVGGHLTKILTLNYTYEFVSKSYMAQPSTTHEFTLGFTLPIGTEKKRSGWRNNYNGR